MRKAAALAILAAALASCGKGAGNAQNVAGGTGLSIPGPRPEAGAGSDQSFRESFRRINMQSCVEAARARPVVRQPAPSEAEINAYCACALDRAMPGLTDDQLRYFRPGPREAAIRDQCEREHGMSMNPDGPESSPGK